MKTVTSFEIPYGETTLNLAVGLAASRAISSVFGGLVTACKAAVIDMDFAAYVKIVALGSGKSISEVEGTVYEGGLHVLRAPIERYLELLANGGREKDVAA